VKGWYHNLPSCSRLSLHKCSIRKDVIELFTTRLVQSRISSFWLCRSADDKKYLPFSTKCKVISDIIAEHSVQFGYLEKLFLRNIHVTLSGNTDSFNVMITPCINLIDLISDISRNRSFHSVNNSCSSESDWLRSLPIFTFCQFIASQFELHVNREYKNYMSNVGALQYEDSSILSLRRMLSVSVGNI